MGIGDGFRFHLGDSVDSRGFILICSHFASCRYEPGLERGVEGGAALSLCRTIKARVAGLCMYLKRLQPNFVVGKGLPPRLIESLIRLFKVEFVII